ncbi:hypothetical protein [Streptomyces sp. NPDC000618]|uniref:hypothetical protein n=1 Tax=Streptomyces sp. NPDC000618 TaxID=3154265 RepID=UPI0033190627
MSERPTAAAPSTTTEVTRALADIEAAKLFAGQDVAECLDAIGDLIRIIGAPETVYAWVVEALSRENLRAFAAQNRITLHWSRASDAEQLPRTAVIWTADGTGMAIAPARQHPKTTLLQLREEIAQREEDKQRARDFQASVAAGHVEDVDTWHARTSQAQK